MNAGLTDEQVTRIRAALHGQNKIEAIKLYREATSVGLAEAKYAVEQMELGWVPTAAATPSPAPAQLSSAEPASRMPAGLGCVILILVVAAGYFGLRALMANNYGEEALAQRYQKAASLILCVWLTASATLNSLSRDKRALAFIMWTTVLALLSAMVYQTVWR
jgi:hypothetical protein